MSRQCSARAAALAALMILSGSGAFADDDTLRAAQSQTAQVIVTARTAALLCPEVEVDENAIYSLMEHTEITDHDIMSPDRFGPEDEAAARSFRPSMLADPNFCQKVFGYLGDRGIKLLRRKPGAP